MRTLFLHIGHGKTGSSYLQSAFRGNRERLARQGIVYPAGADRDVTDPLAVTPGNGPGLLSSEGALAAALVEREGEVAGRSALFSSEWLIRELHARPDLGFLPTVAGKAGYARVAVLLFVRDPLGDAASRWRDWIKSRGHVGPIEDCFRAFERPEMVADVLDRLGALEGVATTVLNYSRCRERLLAVAGAWLGLAESLVPPPVPRVNRALSAGELVFQRALNAAAGASGGFLAERLCKRLPDVETDDLRPSLAVQEETWARLLPAIERVNAHLPEGQRYRCDVKPPLDLDGEQRLGEHQLRVIAEEVGGEIRRLREKVEVLGAERTRLRERLEGMRRDPGRTIPGRLLVRGLATRLRDLVLGRPPARDRSHAERAGCDGGGGAGPPGRSAPRALQGPRHGRTFPRAVAEHGGGEALG